MSLDLAKAALQIDGMADELRGRQDDRRRRLDRAMEAVSSFDVDAYQEKGRQSEATLLWRVPGVLDSPAARYPPPQLSEDFCVVATDGSHIDVDRHMPARCFLINIGTSVLIYGSEAGARLFNRPRLYATERELVLQDNAAPSRWESIEGAILGAKRMVEEARALVEAVRHLPEEVPTVALMDGSLIMLGLSGQGYHDFVRRQLIEEGFVRALDELRELARDRTLAVASYISLPGSAEVVNALRLAVCPYETADCGTHCGSLTPGSRPCDEAAHGLLDRDLWSEILEPGERSGVFVSASLLVKNHYLGHEIHFFYVHAGEEIGRVEVPSWVATDETLLGLTHSLIVDQCRRGPGYPVALMEAHEQAVVTASDRRNFVQMVEEALHDQRMPVYTSEKNRSKRLRWL